MAGRFPVYRSFVRLYPKEFRARYGEDLVQHFGDLVTNMGRPAAWYRTGVDLVATIPRYRLETIMSESTSGTVVAVVVALLAAAGVSSFLTGFGPGIALFLAAVVVAAAQRTALARSIRTPDAHRRRRRLRTAAVFASIFLVSLVSYVNDVSDADVSGTSLVVHNAVGVTAMVGAIVFLVVGLCTPKRPTGGPDTASRPA